jgi:hypothetical protein
MTPLLAMEIGAVSGSIGGEVGAALSGKSLVQIAKAGLIGGVIGGFCGLLGGSMIKDGCSIIGTMAFTSFFGSGISNLANGNCDAPTINFGIGNINLGSGKIRTLFSRGNNAADYLSFGLGALGDLSDLENLNASITAKYRTNNIDQNQLAEYEGRDDGLISHGNYLGPSGTNSPYARLLSGTGFTDEIDEDSYYHDCGYYDNGADGVMGALFDTKVISIDQALVAGARNILSNAGQYLPPCDMWAARVNYTFSAIIGLKSVAQNSYLFP